jgi:GNAT superfamily N-acetyltransferase
LPLEIRTATVKDVAAIVTILISSKQNSLPELVDQHDLNVGFWSERWRAYLTAGSRAQMARGDGFALIAEDGGVPVAFAAYHHTRRHGADAELESLYVLKEAQRKGIGSALIRAVASRLVAEGDHSMCVGYDPRNPYKRFYLKHGALEINPHWAMWRNLAILAD